MVCPDCRATASQDGLRDRLVLLVAHCGQCDWVRCLDCGAFGTSDQQRWWHGTRRTKR